LIKATVFDLKLEHIIIRFAAKNETFLLKYSCIFPLSVTPAIVSTVLSKIDFEITFNCWNKHRYRYMSSLRHTDIPQTATQSNKSIVKIQNYMDCAFFSGGVPCNTKLCCASEL